MTPSSLLRPVSASFCSVTGRVREPFALPNDHAWMGSTLPLTANGSISTVSNSVFERSSTASVT